MNIADRMDETLVLDFLQDALRLPKEMVFCTLAEQRAGSAPRATAFYEDDMEQALDLADCWSALQRIAPCVPLEFPADSELDLCSQWPSFVPRTISNPSPSLVAGHLMRLLGGLPRVVGGGAFDDGGQVRIVVVIEERDLDLWEDVFGRAAALYDIFPDLRAEFVIAHEGDPEARQVTVGQRGTSFRLQSS